MNIEKRNFPLFSVLNCITLGIYGTLESNKIGKEINALCKGDGEEPRLSYAGALLIRSIPTFLGLIVGLIVGCVAGRTYSFSLISGISSGVNPVAVFSSIIISTLLFSTVGDFISSLYLKYWWFKQTSRLKLNANRYNLEVRESGADHFVFRTGLELPLLLATAVLKLLSLLIPTGICLLIALGSPEFAIILYAVFILAFCIFNAEISAGASFSLHYVFKTLNRYSTACRNGGKAFDPMAYEYYPSVNSTYPSFVPQIIDGTYTAPSAKAENAEDDYDDYDTLPKVKCGTLVGLKGACAGYSFDLVPGEEIVIGKDAKVASVVIDTAYKEISRKHVSIIYDAEIDRYRVTDYSSNGTWADGTRIPSGETVNLRSGTILKLANDKNTFRLA